MLICDIKHYIYGEFLNWLSFDLLGIINPILKSVSAYYVPGPVLDRSLFWILKIFILWFWETDISRGLNK